MNRARIKRQQSSGTKKILKKCKKVLDNYYIMVYNKDEQYER